MHRIEGENYDDSSGVRLYTEGPPGTRVTANALNSIQEEIAYVITQSGQTLETAATDTWHQLYNALSHYFEAAAYESIMTADETFGAGIARRRKYLLDPNGADRNFDPSGTFATGYEVIILNVGVAFNIVFDSAASAQVVTPGTMATFIYDGTIWR
uniref:Uncharacterized protein n=1 Tax=viral metagenome TaxID=1070528 RepID=A0A6M3ITR0_9ZZZZ